MLQDLTTPSSRVIEHELAQHFPAIMAMKTLSKLYRSALYQEIKEELEDTLSSLEWGRAKELAPARISEPLRVANWNIERGKELDAILHYLRHDSVLSRADILLLNEVDIGMGRTGNRNIAKELAEALGMYYVYAPSFMVLCKGVIGERCHDEPNRLGLYGDAVLSRYPILSAANVPLIPTNNYFESSEPRLGHQRGLIARVQLPDGPLDCITTHLDLFASTHQRAQQLKALLSHVEQLEGSTRQLIGGDLNTITYNLKNKLTIATSIVFKLLRVGFNSAIEHYMTPELLYERPVFEVLNEFGYEVDAFNDRSKGTYYYDTNDELLRQRCEEKVPNFSLRWLEKRLKPWGGVVEIRLDWFAGRNITPITDESEGLPPQVIEYPSWQGRLASDHNPIVVDLKL